MFMGEYQHALDPKGRLIIPAKFRLQLGERFVITRGMDQCLAGYPLIEWQAIQKRLAALPSTNPRARKFVRYFYAAAVECDFDKQGRVNLPENLQQYAHLEHQCAIVGVAAHFELWDAARWQLYQSDAATDFDALAASFEDLNL